MSQKATKTLLTIGILILHILTAVKTGLDTYAVSGDLLNVVLIDATFVTAALAAAYLGGSVEALFIRPVAAVLAWVLYVQMVLIGFEANVEHPEIAIAVRSAGFGLLILDTWTYIVAAGKRLRQSREGASTDWRASLRGGVASVAYVLASVLLAPLVALVMLGRSLVDYVQDSFSKRRATGQASNNAWTIRANGPITRFAASKPLAMDASDPSLTLTSQEEYLQNRIGRPSTYKRSHAEPADYKQNDDGTWEFICPVCGPEHEGARLTTYPDEKGARRGYAAHQAVHNRQSPQTSPIIVGNGQ